MSEKSPRKLAAIMIADIAGYSRLMGADERGTHMRVQGVLRELVEPSIAEHRGRTIRTSGDGFLAIFDSPVEAVRCAIVIQQSMVGRNLELAKDRWIRFRIGVNLGDVIVEPDDIYGEGVNVAARLEQLAEPGDIYISGGVYEQIRYKLVCGYQSLGDRRVKNIQDPVPIYRVLPDPAAMATAVRRGRVRAGVLAAVVVIAMGIGGSGWYFWQREQNLQAIAAAKSSSAQPVLAPSATSAPPGEPRTTADTVGAAASAPPAPLSQSSSSPDSAQRAPEPEPPPSKQAAAALRPPQITPSEPVAVTQPEMIALPGGTFRMGSNDDPSEQPPRGVTVKPFLIGKYPITVRQWRECVNAKVCTYVPAGSDDAPISNVSWDDAHQYLAWLSQATQQPYRLPTEAEWEYAARGGTETKYWWGNTVKPGFADCKGCGGPQDSVQPVKVGTHPPNPFGLFDIGSGGVTEWVEDCWFKDYRGAPIDGSARLAPNCRERVLRGGSWRNDASYVRAASRDYYDASVRYPTHGFRVARSR
ncbi:MAG: SUMF1/EgtB/PvdO family nonheme iron enzyme [Acetobacteraceae bacterium]|nr:SUMF1/EgtB/PvdO family nonheme iron enzyme [Acetobacteraceae bacterium]